jgi:putative RecB family exonuclease
MSIDLLPCQDLPTAQGGVWQYISPSRLNCWLSCPLKFKLKYIDGMRSPTTPALFLGKVVHNCLETFYRHRQLGIALAAADLDRRLLASWGELIDEKRMRFDTAAEERVLQRQAADLVKAYLEHVPADEPRPFAVEAAVEMPLIDPVTSEDFGIPLVAIMDLVLDGQAGPIIADFKSSSRNSEPLEIVHEVQLISYALLFRHVSGRRETGLEIRSLIKTKAPKIEFHRYPPRTEAHFRCLFTLFHQYLDALERNRFSFRPGFGCAMCEFRDGLCRRS